MPQAYRLEIKGADRPQQLKEVEHLVGSNRLYQRGTDRALFLDCRAIEEPYLLAINLGMIPGVSARVLPGG